MSEAQLPSGYGSGVKQRDIIRMTLEEIDAFLHEWHTMNCATFNHDETIHLVALWYGFLEGAPAFHTKAKSQKIVNLRRDHRITCLLEAGDRPEEVRGVELVGRAEIIEDPERLFAIGVSVLERSLRTAYAEEMRPTVEMILNKRVGVKIHVERFVSWDHRKLAAPS